MIPQLLVGFALIAEAAETGDVRGVVHDADGLPVPSATVVLSGAQLAGDRTVTTDSDGRFTFLAIPPGTHALRVDKGGFRPVVWSVVVRLDETAYVPITLEVGGPTEVIVVEAALPVVDASRSAISAELDDTFLQNLPVGRSVGDAVNMVPGVYGRINTVEGGPGEGAPSVRGEGEYGNNWMIDGISTRDPATKTSGAETNFDAIESIQVYTDGAPAEFGQATGMLVNVVTKDGGDEHHGTAAYYVGFDAQGGTYPILDLVSGREVETRPRDLFTQELSLTAGGPFVKEKLWYFVALDGGVDTISYEGTDPAAPFLGRSLGGFAKVTWFLTPDLSLQYQIGADVDANDNNIESALYAADAQERYRSWSIHHVATARWRPDAASELQGKLSWLPITVRSTPMSDDPGAASFVDLDTGRYYGNFDSYDLNERSRLGGSLTYSRLVPKALGSHRFKMGVEAWWLRDARDLTFTGEGDGYQYEASVAAGLPCVTADHSDCAGYTQYGSVGGALGHLGVMQGVFLQDDWRPVERLTLNVGARVDRESLFQNEGIKVIDALMPAPRLGLAWDVTGDSKTLVSLNAGRYYDLSGNSFADWADTRSAYIYEEYDYNTDTGTYDLVWVQDPESDPLVYCTDSSLEWYEGFAVDSWGMTPEQAAEERRVAETYCDGKLKPYHLDKLVLGFKREIVPKVAVGLRGIASVTRNIPEDIDTNLNTWVIANSPNKYRTYQAIEVTLDRKYDERWQALVAYTLSASRGHMPGQFELSSGGQSGSSGNEVGVYMDDVSDPDVRAGMYDAGGGSFLDGLGGLGTATDDAGYFGYLPYHSFHQIKANVFYRLPFGTNLGLVYEFDSGHAWQKRALVPLYGDYYGFPEGRGSRFMPAVHYVDVRVAQRFDLDDVRSLEASIDIFNLPGLTTPITAYENDNASFGTTLNRQEPRAIRAGMKLTY